MTDTRVGIIIIIVVVVVVGGGKLAAVTCSSHEDVHVLRNSTAQPLVHQLRVCCVLNPHSDYFLLFGFISQNTQIEKTQ
jgi:hypothetical protein